MNETQRIKKVYERRKIEQKDKLYSYFNKANLFIIHQREKTLLETLRRFKFSNLSDKKILDVGCGLGGTLRKFVNYGARPEDLYGIDLLSNRIKIARYLSPNINFICRDVSNLPYKGDYFDIVMQFTMFTSILDFRTKQRIAKEMLRVLKPKGIILWYDYHVNNPKNPDVNGVKKKEIKQLFANCSFRFRRVTLAPPLTRWIAPYSLMLCYLLEKITLLCTHYLAVIKKQNL